MRLLYDGFHKIEEIDAEIKGKAVKRERLKLPSAVGALVTDQDGDFLLVRQYRPTIGRFTYEIPAGVIDKPHLTPYGIILEELEEECRIYEHAINFDNHNFDSIFEYFMVTGSSNATMNIYQFQCVSSWKSYPVIDKDVESVTFLPKHEIRDMLKRREFIDPKTIIAVQHYLMGDN